MAPKPVKKKEEIKLFKFNLEWIEKIKKVNPPSKSDKKD